MLQPALPGCSRPTRKLRAAPTVPPIADPLQRHLPSAPAGLAITGQILTPQKWHALVSIYQGLWGGEFGCLIVQVVGLGQGRLKTASSNCIVQSGDVGCGAETDSSSLGKQCPSFSSTRSRLFSWPPPLRWEGLPPTQRRQLMPTRWLKNVNWRVLWVQNQDVPGCCNNS